MSAYRPFVVGACVATLAGSVNAGTVLLNELRISEPGADNNEFVELIGPPTTSLDGLTFIVLGDSADGSGVIEEVTDLTGLSIGPSGLFLIADPTLPSPVPDLVTDLNFENSQNSSYLLVQGFTGADAQDLDIDDDGILDVTPWTAIVDCVSLVGAAAPLIYCTETVGPDGAFTPGHIYRCVPDQTWVFGPFAITDDTPGAPNLACPVLPNVDVFVDKSGATVAVSGQTATYEITVGNLGTEAADNVSIIDTLPAGLTFSSESSPLNVMLVDNVAPTIEWSIASLGPGEFVDILLQVNIDGALTGTVTNSVAISTTTPGDDPLDNNDAIDTVVMSQVVAPTGLQISELRNDQAGADLDEYFELTGPASTSLNGLSLVVLGDGAAFQGSGVIDDAIPMPGLTMPADGVFLCAEDTITLTALGNVDLVLSSATNELNFENSDNMTYLLVANFVGGPGDDLDTNDDGILDVTPWSDLLDAIGLLEETAIPPTATEYAYGASLGFEDIGPDGGFVPGHAYRCNPLGVWAIGIFDLLSGQDTPGATNTACTLNLGINKTGPSVATIGSQITYTLTVTNTAREDAPNVTVTDLLPAGMTFVAESSPVGVTATDTVEPDIVWDAGTILAGETVVIELLVQVNAGAFGDVVNTATVATSGNDADPLDNTSSQPTSVNPPVVPPAVLINEIRIDEPGADPSEYFELRSGPNVDLSGLTYLVIGDSFEGGSGVIESVTSLNGFATGPDGLFLAVEDTFLIAPLFAADMVQTAGLNGELDFENSDTVTHALVANFTGGVGMDLDTNDDGVLDMTPWTSAVDAVGLLENMPPPPVGADFAYGAALGGEDVGPDGTFVPAHVYRCDPSNSWTIGTFDPLDLAAADTPAAPNAACPPEPCPADTNNDGMVNVTDLVNVILDWGTDGSANNTDIDGSGVVDVTDLVNVILGWGACP